MKWCVWRVTYGTYDDPDVPAQLITGPMLFEQAIAIVHARGFGYCVKPGATI